MGLAVAETDPEQARACLRDSREGRSTALGYQSATDLVWAAGMAFSSATKPPPSGPVAGPRQPPVRPGRGRGRFRPPLDCHHTRRHPARRRRDHSGRRRRLRWTSGSGKLSDQGDRDGSGGRGARPGTAGPRRGQEGRSSPRPHRGEAAPSAERTRSERKQERTAATRKGYCLRGRPGHR